MPLMFFPVPEALSTGAGDGATSPGLSWWKPRVVAAGWLFAGGA